MNKRSTLNPLKRMLSGINPRMGIEDTNSREKVIKEFKKNLKELV